MKPGQTTCPVASIVRGQHVGVVAPHDVYRIFVDQHRSEVTGAAGAVDDFAVHDLQVDHEPTLCLRPRLAWGTGEQDLSWWWSRI